MTKQNRLSWILPILAAVIVASLVSFWIARQASSPTPGSSSATQVGFEKIKAAGIVRCGYVTYPPGLIKDPNTGKISGIFPEVLEQAAKNLGLKVQWSEEVGWGTMVEGLRSSRYDMICSPVWPISQRIPVADFTYPIYYGGAEAYVRANDHRFDENLNAINDPQIRIATTDGEVSDSIAQSDFPKAQRVSLPQLTDLSQLLLTVADGKADVTFLEPFVAFDFLKSHPGAIRGARPGKPVRLYPNTMMLRQEDQILRRVIDNATIELLNTGFVDQVLRKYEPFPGAFYRNAKPIQ